jgi:hypothetical protein
LSPQIATCATIPHRQAGLAGPEGSSESLAFSQALWYSSIAWSKSLMAICQAPKPSVGRLGD